MAQRHLRRERSNHTLQATALVHEAYLRLVDQTAAEWGGRAHFFAVAAQAMRRILVDHARNRLAQKRGGEAGRVSLEEVGGCEIPAREGTAGPHEVDLIDLNEALDELGALDAQLVRVVELRYFAGMTVEEAAEVLGVSPRTVKRAWAVARAWLYGRLGRGQ